MTNSNADMPTLDPCQPHEDDSDSRLPIKLERGPSLSQEDPFQSQKMTPIRLVSVLALSLCFTGSQISTFLVGPALPYIAEDLHLGIEESWIANASALAGAAIIISLGYLQDITGRRVSLATGLAFTLIGTTVFGTAHSFAQAVTAQVLIGIGSQIQELTSVAAIAELVPMDHRGAYLALPTFLSTIFGPAVLYANELSTHASWRWLLWISLIWNGITTIFLGFTYFRMKLASSHRRDSPKSWREIDFLGIFLLTVGMSLVLVAINSGGLTHSWKSSYVLVQLILGVILLGLFVLWEIHLDEQALVPQRLFKGQRVVALAFVIAIFAGFNFTTALNLGPTIVQQVFRLPPLNDALVALGAGLGLGLGASAGNALLTLFKGRCREILTVATVIMTAFTGAQASVSLHGTVVWVAVSTIGGLGIGAALIPVSTLVTLACPQDLIGTAVALIIALRTLGGSVGYSIFYNIYESHKESHFSLNVGQAVLQAGLPQAQLDGFLEAFGKALLSSSSSPGNYSPSIVTAAYQGYAIDCAAAARLVFLTSIAFGSLAILASLSLPDMRRFLSGRVLSMSL